MLSALCVLPTLAGGSTATVAAPSTSVIVSQVYGGATYTGDFSALFDRGAQPRQPITAERAGFPIQLTSEP